MCERLCTFFKATGFLGWPFSLKPRLYGVIVSSLIVKGVGVAQTCINLVSKGTLMLWVMGGMPDYQGEVTQHLFNK